MNGIDVISNHISQNMKFDLRYFIGWAWQIVFEVRSGYCFLLPVKTKDSNVGQRFINPSYLNCLNVICQYKKGKELTQNSEHR